MLGLAASEAFLASLPSSVTMPNGDVLAIKRFSALTLEEGSGDDDYPLIVYDHISDAPYGQTPINNRYHANPRDVTATTQAITFATGTLDYAVAEKDIASGTVTVTGTRSGSPHTFVTLTDFTVVDTNGDGGLDTIRWTAGGQKPDNATSFTVAYSHYTPSVSYGEAVENTLQVHAHTRNLNAGEHGATAFHHREDIMSAIMSSLRVWSAIGLSRALAGKAVVTGRGNEAPFSFLEGKGIVRKGFDIRVAQTVTEAVKAQSILTVAGTSKVNGGDEANWTSSG